MAKGQSLEQRFNDKWIIDPETGCWLWIGAISGEGYSQIWNGKSQYPAHRISYELHRGSISEGLEIDHLCRVKECVNPNHLEAVSHSENVKRGISSEKMREYWNNHPYCPNGDSSGYKVRKCRTCSRIDSRERMRIKGGYYERHPY